MSVTKNQGNYNAITSRAYLDEYIKLNTLASSPIKNTLSLNLLTGFAPLEDLSTDAINTYLALTKVNLKEVTDSWKPEVNTKTNYGHTFKENDKLIKSLTKVDRELLMFNMMPHLHEKGSSREFQLIFDYNLYEEKGTGGFLNDLPKPLFNTLKYAFGNEITKYPTHAIINGLVSSLKSFRSTTMEKKLVSIFKNRGVTLSSIEDFYKGKKGWQQVPFVANVGKKCCIKCYRRKICFSRFTRVR